MAAIITLPVVEVTLLEDRAQVVREGRVQLRAGINELRVETVAPAIVDKTLRGRGPDGVEIADLRVDRREVVSESERPDEVAALQAEHRLVTTAAGRLAAEEQLLRTHVEQLGEASRMAHLELAEDASWGRLDPGGWEERFETLREAEQVRISRLAQVRADKKRRSREIRDLTARRAATEDVRATHRADLTLRVVAADDGEVDLRLDYLVPGACWRPWHRATLTAEGELTFRCDGAVWQRTGEDWTDVRVFFSTERPSLGVSAPELVGDHLVVRKIGSTVTAQMREQEIHTAGLGGGEQATAQMPGIDDGGEARHLAASSAATIPSDGRPHRFPIFEFATPAAAQRVLMAELTSAVLLRSEQAHGGDQPILPGPVDLVRDSGLVGRTWVDFVAPAERFELGWGPDLALRVHREHERKDLDKGLLSSWTGTKHSVTVRLSNIGPEDATVRVSERVPVSELDKVKIEMKSADPKGSPDRDGLMHWDSVVPGYGQDELLLEYEVRQHSDVVGLDL